MLGNGEAIEPGDALREPRTRLWRLSNAHGGPYPGRVVWITEDGRAWFIEKMETRHIRNCIAAILLRDNWRGNYMPLLTAELERRQQLEKDHDLRPSDGDAAASD